MRDELHKEFSLLVIVCCKSVELLVELLELLLVVQEWINIVVVASKNFTNYDYYQWSSAFKGHSWLVQNTLRRNCVTLMHLINLLSFWATKYFIRLVFTINLSKDKSSKPYV